MTKYRVDLKLLSKDSDNEDIQDTRVVFFNPDDPILINGNVLEWISAKYLSELTPYDSVIEWTATDGRTVWKVEEIKKVNF